MRHFRPSASGFAIAVILALLPLVPENVVHADMSEPLETRLVPEVVQSLFPGADGIGAVVGEPPIAPVLAGDETIGYLFSTHETVRPSGFSGASFDIVVGLDIEGFIIGHRILEEHEPMIADSIVSHATIDKFLSRLHGTNVRAMRRLVLRQVDALTGATVSAKAFATGVTNAATVAGYRLGMIDDTSGGLAINRYDFEARGWSDLIADGSVRTLSLTYRDVRDAFAQQLGRSAGPDVVMGPDDEMFITFYVALATPPTIGANLIGPRAYQRMTQNANPRAHYIVIASAGKYDWKPAKHWGIPVVTSVSIVQNGKSMPQQPAYFDPLSRLAARDAPPVSTVARFSLPPRFAFNATEPWTVKLHLNEQEMPGMRPRRVDFDLPYRIPAAYVDGSDYALEEAGFRAPTHVAFGLLRESKLTDWQRTWVEKRWDIIALAGLLAAVSFAVIWQSWLSRSERRRVVVRYGLLTLTLVWLGWLAGGQLTIVSVTNYAWVLVAGLDWSTILHDPLLLILSVYVVVSLVLWGRGVFCGWLCPFGALQEILNKLGAALHVPQIAIPALLNRRLRLAKYGIAAVLVGLAAFSLPHALVAMEVEPFKTVMTAKFDRSWPYVFYACALLFAGLFVERFFCRYLCPLGAVLAVAGKLRLVNVLKRRAECGSPCRLCERRCPIDAIEPNGRINTAECFYCLDCQVLYYDEHACPPLVRDPNRRAQKLTHRQSDLERVPIP